ncbi:uncharacterized protein LOC105442351 [Strongylocentrotus purpuratus]|uniref:Uncharacterized protein n=1 Tax=Strongylocentrotus purpuratus TaxID=7668 RepID=A0A7M7SUZ5_STRPU|nr:uncharacterized protein LOC105442351 [Strongylocentrotus purpuratus]
MENYAAVANCYEDSKPADSTPHEPYYLTLEPDSDKNGGFGTSVAEQPSPHLWKGVTQDDTPSVIKGSNGWNKTDTEDGFVDNVLYGTNDEQSVSPSSLNHNSTDHKAAKHHAITKSHQGPGRPKPGNPTSGAPETDEDAYEGYEDEKVMVDNELYGAPSQVTPRAHKHGAVADQDNDAVYENPDGNVYETYEEEDSMIDNELYGAATPPTPRADNTNDPVIGEGDAAVCEGSPPEVTNASTLILGSAYQDIAKFQWGIQQLMEVYRCCAAKPTGHTPHEPHFPTVEADIDQNGGFENSVAEQPSPHLGFEDRVLYGTSDEQTVRPSSLERNSTDQSPGRPKLGHPGSGAPETDEDAFEGNEDEEIMVDNELYGASFPTTPRAHKVGPVVDQGDDAVYEIPDGSDPVVGEGDGEMYQNTEFHSVPTNLTADELYKSVDEI